jgi:putative ABC transport system permease protein
MLELFFHNRLSLIIAQATVAFLLALVVVLIARQHRIHLERDTIIALTRGLVQIVAVGSILLFLLRGPQWSSIFVLLLMFAAAAATAARRAGDIPGAFTISLYSIGLGSGSVILLMTWLGVIDPAITSVVPVGSMLIANAMNTNALALDRFRSEIASHIGQIETGLALGGRSRSVVAPYVQSAVQASLIPRIDSLRSLGIVWIPGLMAGMVLSGEDPAYAAVYQFVVMALVFVVSGLTSVISVHLTVGRVFSPAEQLLLRSDGGGKPAKKRK